MKIFLIFILAGILFVSGCTAPSDKDYTEFTLCLRDAGIKEYGGALCQQCTRVALTLGEAHKNVDYVECDPRCMRNDAGDLAEFCKGYEAQSDHCLEVGVTHTPSWVQDGEIIHMGSDLNGLAEASGCPLPE